MATLAAMSLPEPVPTRAAIRAASDLLGQRVRRTPVVDLALEDRTVTLKLELMQHTGSFKPRGAFLSVLTAPTAASRLVAASGGNHGLAVAHVGARLGLPTEVFVPTSAPQVKVEGIRRLGATVTAVGASYAEAHAASAAAAAEDGTLAVHAYDSLPTVTGQGTVAREIDDQVPDLDTVLVAVGGGGLVGGVAAWFAGQGVRVVAVEPTGCPTLHAAVAAGEPVTVPVGGLAADALGASRIGETGFAAFRAAGGTSVLVEDAAVVAARRRLWSELRVAAEPGGAVALAALLGGAYVPAPGERTCVLVCGGNADPAELGYSTR